MNPVRRFIYPALVIVTALLCILLILTMQGLGLVIGFALLLSSLMLYQIKKVAVQLEALVAVQGEAASNLRIQNVRQKSELGNRPQA